ncbi:MAG: hypothetical protein ACREA0_24555, partial [bacterium]
TKIVLADHGRKADALNTLRAARAWAESYMTGFADDARPYLTDEGPFRDRLAQNMVVSRFLLDFYRVVHAWAEWGEQTVMAWPDDLRGAQPDLTVLEDVVRTGDAIRAEARRTRASG